MTVPGAIDAFVEVQRRHGKLTFAEVLEPAIYYAKGGFQVSEVIAQQWQAAVPVLSQFPSSAQTYLVDGQAPLAGDVHPPTESGTHAPIACGRGQGGVLSR